jgi:hypothetical protein
MFTPVNYARILFQKKLNHAPEEAQATDNFCITFRKDTKIECSYNIPGLPEPGLAYGQSTF